MISETEGQRDREKPDHKGGHSHVQVSGLKPETIGRSDRLSKGLISNISCRKATFSGYAMENGLEGNEQSRGFQVRDGGKEMQASNSVARRNWIDSRGILKVKAVRAGDLTVHEYKGQRNILG